MSLKSEVKSKLLYCSFCGKSQHEVKKLIAGPSVFVCDECTVLCVDIIVKGDTENGADDFIKDLVNDNPNAWEEYVTPEGVETIVREIQFPPEFQQAGITILSNFSALIREKYKEQNVKVSIQQDNNTITLIIEGEDGIKEHIVEDMNSFSLVIQGKKDVEDLTSNQIQLIEIKQQFRIAQLQMENQKELLAIEKRHSNQLSKKNKSIESQYKEMINILSTSLSKNTEHKQFLQKLLKHSMKTDSILIKKSLDSIFSIIESDNYEENMQQVISNLETINQEDPTVIEKITHFTESCAAGVVGNSLYSWLLVLLQALPK